MDDVFVKSMIIKVEVRLTEADKTYRDLDYSGYHKSESNDCFIIHCFKENNYERTVEEANRRDMF